MCASPASGRAEWPLRQPSEKLHIKNGQYCYWPLSNGAGEETRTLDVHLGKVVLYQLSYARETERRVSGATTTPSTRIFEKSSFSVILLPRSAPPREIPRQLGPAHSRGIRRALRLPYPLFQHGVPRTANLTAAAKGPTPTQPASRHRSSTTGLAPPPFRDPNPAPGPSAHSALRVPHSEFRIPHSAFRSSPTPSS